MSAAAGAGAAGAGAAEGALAESGGTLFITGVRVGDFGTGCPTGFRGAGAGGVSGAGNDTLLSTAGGAESAARTAAPEEAGSLVQLAATRAATMLVTSRVIDGAECERNMYMSPVE